MRVWSRSRGSMARSWMEKPCSVGQRVKSARILEATSASSRTRRLSGRPGLNSRVFICSAFRYRSVTADTTGRYKSRHRGFPERTTAETRERELLHECENCYSRRLVQGPCKGSSPQQLRSVRLLLEELGQGARDVLEDLAVLLRGEPRHDADVGDEELVVLAAHRKSPEFRAALEERLHLLIELGFDSHGSTVSLAGCASAPRTRARPGYAASLHCRRGGAT